MPLEHGKSKTAFSHNVATEMRAGKPQKQAVAIAYSEKRKHMAEGGLAGDSDMMEHIAGELLSAIQNSDKAMVIEALKALVGMIQQEDQEQDQEMGG